MPDGAMMMALIGSISASVDVGAGLALIVSASVTCGIGAFIYLFPVSVAMDLKASLH